MPSLEAHSTIGSDSEMENEGSIHQVSSPNVSVEKVSLARSKSKKHRNYSSRSSSPSQDRSLSQHGRKKGRSKRRSSSHSHESVADRRSSRPSLPTPNVLCTSKKTTNIMPLTRDQKRQMKRKHESLLEELATKGFTLDENSKIIPLPEQAPKEEEEDEEVKAGVEDDDTSVESSGDESEAQVAAVKPKYRKIKAKKPIKESKMVAAMRKQLAIVKSKNKPKVQENDETILLIKECVRKHLWPLCKIVNSETTQNKAAMMCLRFLDLDEFNGEGEEYDALREEWVASYAHIVTSEINGHRSYTQNRVKRANFNWMDDHEGNMISEELLKKIINRDIDLNNEDEVEGMKWWWDDCLVYAAGNLDDWHSDKRHYVTISKGAPPEIPGKFYITASTEGIAMAFIENNRSRWKALYDAKKRFPQAKKFIVNGKVKLDEKGNETAEFTKDHKGIKGHYLCNGHKYMTKWTESAGGQQEYSGWSKEGRDYYVTHFRANEAAREKPTTDALEQAILAMIREDYGKTAKTALEEKAAKKRKSNNKKAAPVEDEDDGMEF